VKKVIRYCYYLVALVISACIRVMPYGFAVWLGGVLGRGAYTLIPEARRIAKENLRRSFPEKTAGEIASLARRVFINQGKNTFELFSFPRLTKDDIHRLVRIENVEAITRGMADGKGVLLASAHCGNWEILGAALSQSGFGVNVIARRIYIEGLNRLLLGLRLSQGMRIIMRSGQESARQMLRSLRNNEILAMLIDQDTDVPGVFVDFFGCPAWTPSGLAALASRAGAAVVLALDIRQPDGSHRVIIRGPLQLSCSGDKDRDTLDNTQMITAMIEQHIRQYPDQWVWIHRRWKTQQKTA